MGRDFEAIGTNAWTALKKNKEFMAGIPPNAYSVLEPIVTGFPGIAGDEILDAKADLSGVINAKIAFIEHAIKQNFMPKFAEAAGLGPELLSMMSQAFSSFIEFFSDIARDIPAFLESKGCSESDALMMIGYDKKLLDKLKKGMSVIDLYETNPVIIVKNT